MLGQPLFPGESGIDQLVEIIKVLGTPTREQIRTMNPNYMEHKFPQIKAHPFGKVCTSKSKTQLLVINPPFAGFPQGYYRRDRLDIRFTRVYADSKTVGYRGDVSTILRRAP